jgi:hypothetical protein
LHVTQEQHSDLLAKRLGGHRRVRSRNGLSNARRAALCQCTASVAVLWLDRPFMMLCSTPRPRSQSCPCSWCVQYRYCTCVLSLRLAHPVLEWICLLRCRRQLRVRSRSYKQIWCGGRLVADSARPTTAVVLCRCVHCRSSYSGVIASLTSLTSLTSASLVLLWCRRLGTSCCEQLRVRG